MKIKIITIATMLIISIPTQAKSNNEKCIIKNDNYLKVNNSYQYLNVGFHLDGKKSYTYMKDKLYSSDKVLTSARQQCIQLPTNKLMATLYYNNSQFELTDELKRLMSEILIGVNMENENIIIDGYADQSGDKYFNKKLSERRAEEVKKHLITQGFKPSNIVIRAYGESEPGKKGRRVEIYKLNA
ncbi:OmpA family protein [Dongshaea marina]|uniref:OmpA family protein n=1 Tax=Dongshaea marina TaxID=2047966 RepID=UPI000D3E71FA|nr:OmpA family protein [Dongshaea marina]